MNEQKRKQELEAWYFAVKKPDGRKKVIRAIYEEAAAIFKNGLTNCPADMMAEGVMERLGVPDWTDDTWNYWHQIFLTVKHLCAEMKKQVFHELIEKQGQLRLIF